MSFLEKKLYFLLPQSQALIMTSPLITLIISGLNVLIVSGSILYIEIIFYCAMVPSSQTIYPIDGYMLVIISA